MENYVGKIRELSEKRTIDLENENTKMRQQLENITSIFDKVILQGDSLTEKVSFSTFELAYISCKTSHFQRMLHIFASTGVKFGIRFCQTNRRSSSTE